ncbi:MAG TPA: TIM barrel protein [Roseiflexaceae bacterium]|nr:TIM barrel protein [Roseiflexaceae bacterium]
MRLGGPVRGPFASPEAWIAAVQAHGYRAAYCPLTPDADDASVAAYAGAAHAAGIVIAEVGAWSNPLSPDAATRAAAIEHCTRSLDLAERIGARCCVNIAGSRGTQWDGPHPENLTDATFALIVDTVRTIIDAVRPVRTRYVLEPMPWMYPDSPDSYLRLLAAIDRPGFAVHLDPVNWISSPQRYFANAELIRESVATLGHALVAVHAKDIVLRSTLTVHLDEVRPGLGGLDYPTLLRELDRLDPDLPLLLEHLPDDGEYRAAATYVRQVAGEQGITL